MGGEESEGWAATPPAAAGNGWLGSADNSKPKGPPAAASSATASSWLGDNTAPVAPQRAEAPPGNGPSFELHTHTVPVDVGTAWVNTAMTGSTPSRGGGAGAWVAILLLVLAVGGGGYYVFTRPVKTPTVAATGTPGAAGTPKEDLSALTPDAFFKDAKNYYAKKNYSQAARGADDALTMYKATKGTPAAKIKAAEAFVRKAHQAYGKQVLGDANKLFRDNNFNGAMNTALEAADILAKGNAPKSEIAKAYAMVARSHKRVNSFDEAEKYFKKAIAYGGPYGAELNDVRNAMAPEPPPEEIAAPPTIEQPSLGEGQGYQTASRKYGSGGGHSAPPPSGAPATEPPRRQQPVNTYVPKPKAPSRPRNSGPGFYNTPNKFGRS